MNLSILLTDFIDTKGMLKTYRFIPINQYNRIVVDRLSDICTDVKGNTEWVLLMRKRRRKTLVVCPECHNLIHS